MYIYGFLDKSCCFQPSKIGKYLHILYSYGKKDEFLWFSLARLIQKGRDYIKQ